MQVPLFVHAPRPLHPLGHSGVIHPDPPQPGSHRHVASAWHTPCCEQSEGHASRLQSLPCHPIRQEQVPLAHTPLLEHELGQGISSICCSEASLQSAPPRPASHTHVPFTHPPLSVQLLGQLTVGNAPGRSARITGSSHASPAYVGSHMQLALALESRCPPSVMNRTLAIHAPCPVRQAEEEGSSYSRTNAATFRHHIYV